MEGHEPLQFDHDVTEEELLQRASSFLDTARNRRSVRFFSDRPVPREVIESCIQVAGTAPSGANKQPWHFVAVGDPELKHKIRIAAEQEEHEFYNNRAPQDWLDALTPMATNEKKPFLEVAPWLVAIFSEAYSHDDEDQKVKHYYVPESVGIATGMLISALNSCGLATLTHTPSPMKFLRDILGRSENQRPFLLLVVGFPSEDCIVPKLTKKSMDELATFHEGK
ncbi:MAG: nitroreductase family protein [Planctomycetota bacterium]